MCYTLLQVDYLQITQQDQQIYAYHKQSIPTAPLILSKKSDLDNSIQQASDILSIS